MRPDICADSHEVIPKQKKRMELVSCDPFRVKKYAVGIGLVPHAGVFHGSVKGECTPKR